jgi:glycosyltransferase involved in cell wall biosynthesis
MIENLSLCIIVKDDEENIKRLVSKAKQYISEVIVVDTGSKDGSVDVALDSGAFVVGANHLLNPETGFIDSFSEARKLSFQYANNDWIMWLDSDDDLSDWEILKNVISEAEEKEKNMVLDLM